jgi:RimJ/RimL family protein N-acetyltransferase
MDDSFQTQALATIQQLKEKPAARACWIPIFQFGRKLAWLEPVTKWDLDCRESIARFNQWRPLMVDVVNPEYPLSAEGTRNWVAKDVLGVEDRLLFWVKGQDGVPLGTVGLSHFDWTKEQVEIDNMVRGVPRLLPGVMYAAVQTLLGWTFQTFAVTVIRVHLASDNARAIRLFERSGFAKGTQKGSAVETKAGSEGGKRVRITMSLFRSDWMAAHRLDKVA